MFNKFKGMFSSNNALVIGSPVAGEAVPVTQVNAMSFIRERHCK